MITIALNKGRPLDECMPLLKAAGVAPIIAGDRRLILDGESANTRFVVIRGVDVPTYVERGVADVGFAGKDTLLEHGGTGYYECLDLGIGVCRLMVAAPNNFVEPPGRLRVAAKFVNVARRHFEGKGRQIDLIYLGGSVELAPLLGLADVIVDIYETGNTLRANGLKEIEVIAPVSQRVIVNKAAMKLKGEEIGAFLARLRKAGAA